METQPNQRPASTQATSGTTQPQGATAQPPKPSTSNPVSAPTQPPAPTPPQDPQAAILAELRALRSSIDATRVATETGFRQLIDELEEDDGPEAEPEGRDEMVKAKTLNTPASHSASAITGAQKPTGSKSGSASAVSTATSNHSTDAEESPDFAGIDKHGYRRRAGEPRSDWLARLRTLPPIGPGRRRMHESRDVYEARRFDGTKAKN